MPISNDKILVPIDFTEVSDCAISHAISFSKIADLKITLLHVLEKTLLGIVTNKQNKKHLQSKLEDIANDIRINHNVEVNVIVRPGNIFETINQVANEIGASFAVMGTHGVKGIQHIKGSRALKIINKSNIPFIVIQKKKIIDNHFNNIVFPIDSTKESKEKAIWAIYVSKIFDSTVNIVVPKNSKKHLEDKVNHNLAFTEKLFFDNSIPYSVNIVGSPYDDIALDTISYAEKINANLIMIMITPAHGSGDLFFTPEQQKIITNHLQIPVMCINPLEFQL